MALTLFFIYAKSVSGENYAREGIFLCPEPGAAMMPVRYPRHADDLSLCLDHSICDRVHIGHPEDYPVPEREITCEGGVKLQQLGASVG